MRFVLSLLFACTLGAAPSAQARLLSFTDDLTEGGTSLVPGFRTNSCWSGITVASDGRVHVCVSNHLQPGGDVAFFRFDPATDGMDLLGTASSVSTAANNWMAAESQYKVHTYLVEDDAGGVWFATMDHAPSPFLRGAHLYRTDVASGVVTDESATAPWLLTEQLQLAPNTGQPAAGSGVTVETYGLKGLNANRRAPDVRYLMTYPDGHLIRNDVPTGHLEVVGQSSAVSYVFHVDRDGDCHYAVPEAGGLRLLEYDRSTGLTSITHSYFDGIELGAVAAHPTGDVVYVLVADTKQVWRLDTRTNAFTNVASACGTNWWRLYNLALSPNGRALYYVSNNNANSVVRRIDLVSGACTEVVNVDALLGTRDLCFGGVDCWTPDGRLYAPVWTWEGHGLADDDVALLEVQTDELTFVGDVQQVSVGAGGTQTLALELGPDAAGATYFVGGTSAGAAPGFTVQGWTIPLNFSPYLLQTLNAANQPPLAGSFGALDAEGRATITFTVPPATDPAFAGTTLHHAAVTFEPGTLAVSWVSRAVSLQLVL